MSTNRKCAALLPFKKQTLTHFFLPPQFMFRQSILAQYIKHSSFFTEVFVDLAYSKSTKNKHSSLLLNNKTMLLEIPRQLKTSTLDYY
jgi:hypothetical protein